jgi:hypothetical protein
LAKSFSNILPGSQPTLVFINSQNYPEEKKAVIQGVARANPPTSPHSNNNNIYEKYEEATHIVSVGISVTNPFSQPSTEISHFCILYDYKEISKLQDSTA